MPKLTDVIDKIAFFHFKGETLSETRPFLNQAKMKDGRLSRVQRFIGFH